MQSNETAPEMICGACGSAMREDATCATCERYARENAEAKAIKTAISNFPKTFGLRAFPGKTFCIDERASYVNSDGRVMLYTYIRRDDGKYVAFAKDTVGSLSDNAITAPDITARLTYLRKLDNELSDRFDAIEQSYREASAKLQEDWDALDAELNFLKRSGIDEE